MEQMLRSDRYPSKTRLWALYILAFAAYFSLLAALDAAQIAPFAFPGDKPLDAPPAWQHLIGEYGPASSSLLVLEKFGILLLREEGSETPLLPGAGGNFVLRQSAIGAGTPVSFLQRGNRPAEAVSLGNAAYPRRKLGPEEGQVFQIQPSRSIDDLRREALSAAPPHENGQFRTPNFVELATLDSYIHLDIRYATANDFLGTPVYTQARAFLQRPAAEALVRAQKRLTAYGYALLIHDAYRPWYVTKIFWEATPPEGKIFVADPAQGSRHNRGCAVDLTLYDLKTSKPVEMPGTYDEMSERSFPDYPGGTSLQRWHRDLLRWAMESEGFTVYDHEWWHFDYKDWHEYPILNVPFEKLQFGAAIH